MTIQSANGSVFDSIVFAERDPRQWLAGSDHFNRTQSFEGDADTEATERPVHLAIVYHQDGRVVGYRDGQRYGKAYVAKSCQDFPAGESVISFGVRHLPATGNRLLSGTIVKARLYNQALSDEQVAASFGNETGFVSDQQVLDSLSKAERESFEELQIEISSLKQSLAAISPLPTQDADSFAWTELARALFLFQEFIYVR